MKVRIRFRRLHKWTKEETEDLLKAKIRSLNSEALLYDTILEYLKVQDETEEE